MGSQSGTEATIESGSKPPEPPPKTGSAALLPQAGLVELCVELTKEDPSPEIFRKWAAIHAVGSAAERRVWTQFGRQRLHPNLFVFLVGPPGVGKTVAINPIGVLLRKSAAVTLAPNDITKQGLLDSLAGCAKGTVFEGRPFDYHFMAILVAELSNFMSKYDDALAGLMTDLFDCPPVNEEKKRSGAGKMIPSPGISLLVGTATKNLGSTISDEMWGSGFMARVILVYSSEVIHPADIFAQIDHDEVLATEIVEGLKRIGERKGGMEWDAEAKELLLNFKLTQSEGAPLHNRLENYTTRRWLHLGKLCMIAALSDERMAVEADDFNTALGWLTEAESFMPEVFKDMVHHEDGQIYEEMRQFVFHMHFRSGHKAIPASILYEWLSKRVSSYSIQRMLEVAEVAGYIIRMAGTSGAEALYKPGSMGGGKNISVI